MRIAIDLQGAQSGSRYRGIGRYTLALADAMVRCGGGHDFLIVLNGLLPETIEAVRASFDPLLPQRNIRVWTATDPVYAADPSNTWRRQAAQLQREAFLASLGADVVHVSSLFEGFGDNAVTSIGLLPRNYVTSVTFYDAIPLLQKEVYLAPRPDFATYYREKIEYLGRADICLAISESARAEAIEHMDIRPQQIVSIGAAADSRFRVSAISAETEAGLRVRFGLKKSFIMYSGATDERKNLKRLIKAFSLLRLHVRERFQLAIVGHTTIDDRRALCAHALACGLTPDEMRITGSVTDEELQALYSLCHLFVFPSWHEGFGLPPLEAMACGAAVIGSNTTSVPEVIGRTDALFDPHDELAIAAKITEAIGNTTFLAALKQHGPPQAEKFSWAKCARLALDEMEKWHVRHRTIRSHVGLAPNDACLPKELIERIGRISGYHVPSRDLAMTSRAIAQNHATHGLPRVLIDVSGLIHEQKLGTVRRDLISELIVNGPRTLEIIPVVFSNRLGGYEIAQNVTAKLQGALRRGAGSESAKRPKHGDVLLLGLDSAFGAGAQEQYIRFLRDLGVTVYCVLQDRLGADSESPRSWDGSASDAHFDWFDVAQQTDGVICESRQMADAFRRWADAFGRARSRALKIAWFELSESSFVPVAAATLLEVILENRWFGKWLPSAGGERFRVTDTRIGTQVGRMYGRELRSCGTAGWLLNGPNISLTPGSYRITIRGRAVDTERRAAYVEVGVNHGKLRLAKTYLERATSSLQASLATLVIRVPETYGDLAIRVWVSRTTKIAISIVEIAPVREIPVGEYTPYEGGRLRFGEKHSHRRNVQTDPGESVQVATVRRDRRNAASADVTRLGPTQR